MTVQSCATRIFLKVLFLGVIFWSVTSLHAQNHNPVNYHFNGTPENGIKIKTNLPYVNGSQMPTIIIEGYNYGKGASIGVMLNWYIYGGNFIQVNASSHGSYSPKLKLANENGKVIIFIDERNYYNRFTIRTFGQGRAVDSSPTNYQGWTAVDEPLTGTNVINVPYKTWVSNNNANVTFIEGKRVGIGVSDPAVPLEVEGQIQTNPGSGGTITAYDDDENRRNRAILGADEDGAYLTSTYNTGGNYKFSIRQSSYKSFELNPEGEASFFARSSTPLTLSRNSTGGNAIQNNSFQYRITSNPRGSGTLSNGSLSLLSQGVDADFALYTKSNGATPQFLVNKNGNVGIGTSNPDGWKLAVNGNVRAKEIKVETGWSDFVFKKDYELPTLQEVEEHIQEKGHLQDIPSAEEVAEHGIFLGEMDSKLLQKIEELMLYTIDQQKQIELLKKQNASFIKVVEEIKGN